jgi:hypothetical protein
MCSTAGVPNTMPPITPLPMGSACVHVCAGWSYQSLYCALAGLNDTVQMINDNTIRVSLLIVSVVYSFF